MTLLVNARLLTMDAGRREIERGWLAIEGDRIAALGAGDPPGGSPDDVVEDMDGDLIMPGMVNPHTHLAMTLFRGLGEDVDDRLFRYILPLERALVTADVVETGARLAALECIQGGVTTVADMYYFEDRIGRVLDEAGLRGLIGQTIANFAAPDHAGTDEAFALLDALDDSYRDHPLISATPAPHAPYSTGPAVMERAAAWAENRDAMVQMHLAETHDEMAWAEREHGCSTVELTRRSGLLTPRLIAAHAMYPSEADMDLIAEGGTGVAHNARANGKGGRGIAPIAALRARGVRVGLGTDGPMSSNTLDLFSQFAPASMFQKIAGGSRKPLPATDVIHMATQGGADILGLGAKIGSLEPGKQADLVRMSLDAPRLQPVYDIYATLVFAALPSDVRATMVAGRWLMRDRVVETVEAKRAVADALQVADRFKDRIREIDGASA
ncbi:amidohydrolase family protein [Oricola sp.]|uniref:amidohydrolase family protein n=1 Tax=Oricola sp. TaxID=1979950 RepID=UPI003BACEC18